MGVVAPALGGAVRPKKCPNRHQYTSGWSTNPTSQIIELPVRKGLLVRLVYQYRYFYPPGEKSSACCTQRRRVPQVLGEIETRRDAERVSAMLQTLAENTGRVPL